MKTETKHTANGLGKEGEEAWDSKLNMSGLDAVAGVGVGLTSGKFTVLYGFPTLASLTFFVMTVLSVCKS
jgi:hypothetical protein